MENSQVSKNAELPEAGSERLVLRLHDLVIFAGCSAGEDAGATVPIHAAMVLEARS
jgi:hypothetical protein